MLSSAVLALLALAADSHAKPGAPGSPGPLSVVVFVLDDVAAADLALYGGPVETPALAELAAEGVLFTNAYANPSCAPTRRSLQFGRWWARGNGDPCEPSPPSEQTPTFFEVSLAEALPRHAAFFVGKWHLGGSPTGGPWACAPIERGYDAWLAGLPGNPSDCGGFGYLQWLRVEAGAGGCSADFSDEYAPRAQRNSFRGVWPALRKPALGLVSSSLAHSPFHRPPPDMLPRDYPPTNTARARFEAMIVAFDRSLRAMLAVVDLERTLVVVIGDNGTPPQVAPDPTRAKGTTFERGVRVPLVVAGASVTARGSVSDALVHALDVWATAVEAGGERVSGTESRSLVPLLGGRRLELHTHVLCGNSWGLPDGDRCVVSASGLKLRQIDADGDELVDAEQLFDLRSDPAETADRSGDPALAPELAELRAWAEAATP